MNEIILNGREVFRVSVVFMDYGSIRDREKFQRFMTVCCNLRFDAINPDDQENIEVLKKEQASQNTSICARFVRCKNDALKVILLSGKS